MQMKNVSKRQLLLEVNFEHIENGTIRSVHGNDGILTGNAEAMCTRSYDGKNALLFSNKAGVPAHEYVDFGILPVGTSDFTIQLWICTHRDGCNGWSGVTQQIEINTFINISCFSQEQQTRGGVMLSNTDFSTPFASGFTLANMQQFSYFSTNICFSGRVPVQITGCKEVDDDRWHQITVTFDRSGMQRVYVDAYKIAEKDISAFSDYSLDAQNLILGADATKMHGLGETAIGELKIWRGTLSESEIRALYYPAAVLKLTDEYLQKVKPNDERFTANANKTLMSFVTSAKSTARKFLETNCKDANGAESLYFTFRNHYEEMLKGDCKPLIKFMLLSDVHVEGVEGSRRAILERALEWACSLHMDAYMDAGDYSCCGRTEELEAYWDTVEKKHGNMKVFIAVGNHETMQLSYDALKVYHLGHLKSMNMLSDRYSETFYEGEIRGYHFLVLAQYENYTESGEKLGWVKAANIEKSQLEWLEQKLKAYCGRGKPVFLTIHNAIAEVLDTQIDGASQAYATIMKCDELYDILNKYPDVVIATGHVHHGLGDCCGLYNTKAGYHVIDVPGFRHNRKGYGWSDFHSAGRKHTGYFVYVYTNQVHLRAVDFATREWLTAYDQTLIFPETQR